MSESLQALTIEEALSEEYQEYLELTRKQTNSRSWTEEDRERLLELKVLLDIDQPRLTQEQKEAFHHQATADTCLTTGGKPQPSLTGEERELIVDTNFKI